MLDSIALEEVALARFLNAEAKKMQSVAAMVENTEITVQEVMDLQKTSASVKAGMGDKNFN